MDYAYTQREICIMGLIHMDLRAKGSRVRRQAESRECRQNYRQMALESVGV